MTEPLPPLPESAALRLLRRLYVGCALALAIAYFSSGVTTIPQGEAAIVLRCGRLVTEHGRPVVHRPGMLIAWPEPFDRILRVPLEREQVVELDFGQATGEPRDDGELLASCFLTGDGNLAQLRLRVKYRITDPATYALRCADVHALLIAAGTSAATARIADDTLEDLLRLRRSVDGGEVVSPAQLIQAAMASRLARTPCGIVVTTVETASIGPPQDVVEAFEEVQTARIEQETHLQRVIGERHATVLEYEALVQQTLAEARGARISRQADAEAAVAHFEADLRTYQADPSAVRARFHREAWNRVLAGGAKVYFVDGETNGAQLRLSIERPEWRP